MSPAQSPSSSPTSTMPVSLPSIHEMFPDHLMRKDAHFHDSERSRSHRGYIYAESPGVHNPHHRHRVSMPESNYGYHNPPPSHELLPNSNAVQLQSHAHRLSPQHTHETSADRERLSTQHSSQNIYAFNVLCSSPTSPSLQHVTSSTMPPNKPANPQQLGCHSIVASGSSPAFRVSVPASSTQNKGHEGHNVRHRRDAMPPRTSSSSSEGAYAAASSSPRTRAPAGFDPYPAIISFPLSNQGPLPSASSKHRHFPGNSPGPGSGASQYEPSYGVHGPFPIASNVGEHRTNVNEEEDDGGVSGADDNDTSNGKKHVCPTCFKRFNRPSSLRIHVNTHTGATPFRCPWPNCGREFNVNSNMRRHYRNHTTPGFSRSQSATNSNNAIPHPIDGRRKRRRGSAPQNPLHTSVTAPRPGPASNSYPIGEVPYRTEYHYPPTPHNYGDHAPYRTHRSHPHTSQSQLQQHPGSLMPSPPNSTLSVSDEDSSSGSDSDMDEDSYPAPRSHTNSKEEHDELLEYDPDPSSLRYRTASLTQSLARVAVAPTNGTSRRGHPYGLYSPSHTHALAYGRPEATRGSEHGYGHPNGHPQRPLTPGSSFHSSSSSPSTSPSPPPNRHSPVGLHVSPQSNYKYSASTPYVRSLADSRVSTTLRPAFGNSSERKRTW